MTRFKVAASSGKIGEYTGHYTIESAGVLTIRPDRGNPVIYSPSGWLVIEIIDGPQSAQERLGNYGGE